MSDIRKWFMKQHDKNNAPASNPEAKTEKPSLTIPEKPVSGSDVTSSRRKTSKYFAPKDEKNPAKRKTEDDTKKPQIEPKKQKLKEEDNDDDFVKPSLSAKKPTKPVKKDEDDKPAKSIKKDDKTDRSKKSIKKDDEELEDEEEEVNVKGNKRLKKSIENDDDYMEEEEEEVEVKKSAGRGRGKGGRGAGPPSGGRGAGPASGGRGRGGGGGGGGRGFMGFGERKDPPHKGEKEVPEGAPNCLTGLTFVISGTLDSLEREEAEDLIKRHGGRITSAVSKKTTYLLCDEDVGGRKSQKATELGVPFLTEDGLFDLIRKSKPSKSPIKKENEKSKISEKIEKEQVKSSPVKVEKKDDNSTMQKKIDPKSSTKTSISPAKKAKNGVSSSLTWTEKYKPKVPNDIIGNQSLVKQLHDWLKSWDGQFLHASEKGKGKKQSDNGSKKAVLLSGSPGIGKSTTAKLVTQMLGFTPIEVNASDSRGKADSKIVKGISGSTSNSVKELVNNATLNYGSADKGKSAKAVLIMDEVDGMSAGDRGGVADLIASIKLSKIPIICICNDRYSQKLKSLVNHCLLLNFRKPTKQQMAKRLMQIATSEGLQVNEIALEELGDRVNGDMRMAINQLQYMSLQMLVIKYDDVRERLKSSAKDEDISPFTAVDKLFAFSGGKLRIDERIDYSMSDPDLVPLIVQENYINYKPCTLGKDENGIKRLKALAKAAESIADGDIVNIQIRRYRQWQLSQASSFASTIVPAALMHGNRETLEPGERNYNRFGGWLGKNSTMGKNIRLLEDVHVHVLASQQTNLDRETLRVDYLSLLLKRLIEPLRTMSKDEAVQKVVEFMDTYSLSQEDFDTILELSKLKGRPNPMEGIQPAVKSALTRAYKQGSSSRVVRAADMINLPGLKKAPKKRIAAILEPPVETETGEDDKPLLAEGEDDDEEEDAEDTDELVGGEVKPKLDLQSDKSKGIQVQLDLKNKGESSSKGKKAVPASKAKASTSGGKRKR